MNAAGLLRLAAPALLLAAGLLLAAPSKEPPVPPFDVNPKPVASDKTVKLDYDIVYVRAKRAGDKTHKRFFTDFSQPVTMEPGADLMLLHPDGTEELLVEGGNGSVTDPAVSFDAQWCYYSLIHDLRDRNQWSPPAAGADIYKIHLKTRKVVRLTNQQFTPNTGVGDWSPGFRPGKDGKQNAYHYGVFNTGPFPLPGGRIAFTSNRDGVRPAKGYPAVCLQLFTMDDRDDDVDPADPYPANIEKIGHLNLAGALHPVALTDGRIMFSSLESQGARSDISWGVWTIHPDGSNWNPLVSAFDPGGASNGFHFQTQLSDGSVVVEGYYNQNNSGFGSFAKLPAEAPYPAFGPAFMNDPRNKGWSFGHHEDGRPTVYRMPFLPTGSEALTPFAHIHDAPADVSVPGDKTSPRVGKVTHPSGAPDNHLLLVWSPGPTNHQYTFLPQLDGGIYLLKDGKPARQPGDLLLVKNDPLYNECWPRAVVPYKRIYGIDEPKKLDRVANTGKRSKHLPEGTPFGLVGTASMLKRESYPNGVVPPGKTTAVYAGGNDPWKGLDAFTSHGNGMPLNWHNQGSDVGLYTNDDVHAVRIVAMEPTTDRPRGDKSGRQFVSHARERLRVLGEIPVRKFDGDKQPTDPDGNPDTSFLAKLPADTAFTFQTLDKDGFVLNSAQTWHQLRPGEVRVDCGGCHAHSQKPTDFNKTLASRDDYPVWDLTKKAPLLAAKAADDTGKKWDADDATGVRHADKAAVSVEYTRDIRPILARSCAACHTKSAESPAGNLVLDADEETVQVEQYGKLPGTYARLAMDEGAKFGHKPPTYDSWGYPNASRYVRKFQARRSLLAWKVYGRRLDGFTNDDHPSPPEPGARSLVHQGKPADKNRHWYDLNFVGSPMPPPEAVKAGKVKPLTDEDRRTLVRWIDLGCPLDQDPKFGYFADDNRPVIALSEPTPGRNLSLRRVLVGLADYGSGLEPGSFAVTADFDLDGVKAGENLASRFTEKSPGVWELTLAKPPAKLEKARLSVTARDRQGNVARVERLFSVEP